MVAVVLTGMALGQPAPGCEAQGEGYSLSCRDSVRSGHSQLLVVREADLFGRVLHQGQHPAGHEAGRPHGSPASGQLCHLDHAAPGPHVDASPSARRCHFVCPGVSTRIDHDLYTITFHTWFNALTCSFSPERAVGVRLPQ
jgi:hypothetical protein